ncbi:universal stress protein [Nevskia soli]|uniref:universal stress protein n=1 Tax=Nevskia soli TaxID=418856 RepID=UPI0004A76ADF|nr:universal stress protein [Nevskia soli]
MNRYETILVIVPSKAEVTPALKRAVELARASGATLHLCVFEYDSSVALAAARVGADVAAHVRHDIMRDSVERLERLAVSLAGKESAIECDVVWSPDEAEAVLAKTLHINAQLVVKDAHHESALRRAIFTPLDWRLIRLLPCELMLVGPGPHPKPKRVAAAIDVWGEPVDADGLNKRIINAALLLAEYLDARLDLVSVFPYFPSYSHSTWPSSKAIYAEANDAHYKAFSSFAAAHSIPEDRRHRPAGQATSELAGFVKDNRIDVLVLGSIYRGGWDRLLLGSTAETVAQEVGADILLVKPANYLDVIKAHIDLSKVAP